jgi:hypothetical protein
MVFGFVWKGHEGAIIFYFHFKLRKKQVREGGNSLSMLIVMED